MLHPLLVQHPSLLVRRKIKNKIFKVVVREEVDAHLGRSASPEVQHSLEVRRLMLLLVRHTLLVQHSLLVQHLLKIGAASKCSLIMVEK